METTAQQTASPTTIGVDREVEVPSSQQDPTFKEVSLFVVTTSVAEILTFEGVREKTTTRTSEIDISARVAVGSSSPKDDIGLFPEILSGTVTAKTIEQDEVATKQVTLDQPQGDDILEEQVPLEQTHPTEVLHFILVYACGYHVHQIAKPNDLYVSLNRKPL